MALNIGAFIDFDPNDKEAWSQFNLIHMLAHQSEYQAMLDAGYAMKVFPLDADLDDIDNWLGLNYTEHISQYDLLGLSGLPDLSNVDMNDPDQFHNWMLLHYGVHLRVDQTLGLA
ncbi:MAG: hypothetical protein IT367_20965 [Candidatus Hydrogenedentes bacterium]|nr:hypothetical protein [Candidatus Hydrogenedentota bacterium]